MERIEEVKKEINADLGLVDILINNAGLVPKISLRDGNPSDVQRLMDVNVMSHFWVMFFSSTCFKCIVMKIQFQKLNLNSIADNASVHR